MSENDITLEEYIKEKIMPCVEEKIEDYLTEYDNEPEDEDIVLFTIECLIEYAKNLIPKIFESDLYELLKKLLSEEE